MILMQIYVRPEKNEYTAVDYETQCQYQTFTNLESAIEYCRKYVKDEQIIISKMS